jgi:hypothetical protein
MLGLARQQRVVSRDLEAFDSAIDNLNHYVFGLCVERLDPISKWPDVSQHPALNCVPRAIHKNHDDVSPRGRAFRSSDLPTEYFVRLRDASLEGDVRALVEACELPRRRSFASLTILDDVDFCCRQHNLAVAIER